MNFGNIKKGDTFDVEEKSGEIVTMKVGDYNESVGGYYTEGRASDGGRISWLKSDEDYEKMDKISKLFSIPMKATNNWTSNDEKSQYQIMGE